MEAYKHGAENHAPVLKKYIKVQFMQFVSDKMFFLLDRVIKQSRY